MAEEHALAEGLGQRCAVDGDERAAAAALAVEGAGDELFACPGGAGDQRREVAGRDAAHGRAEIADER